MSDSSPPQRDSAGRWLPGVSPNPGGRPATSKRARELALSVLLDENGKDIGFEACRATIRSSENDQARMAAIKHLHAYAYGLPPKVEDSDVEEEADSVVLVGKAADEVVN